MIFDTLQVLLSSQHFPMVRFERMRDSVDIYFKFVLHLHQLEKKNDHAQFLLLLNEDRGYAAFRAYKSFSDEIDLFEERLFAQYDSSYESALRSTLLFQIVLFLVSIPSLTYTTVFASRSLSISEKLRRAQQETAEILEQQKQKLEMVVRSRTNEIRKQNEEITLSNQQFLEQQREIEQHHHALSQQSAQIKGAHHIIELQNTIIQKKNEELKQEVALQVQDLRKTNAELLEQNSRLEQFAFIISHNVRAPMTRIVGLASVISLQPTEQERRDLIEKMVLSTRELDEVIKDLSMIIQIQNLNTSVYRLISLPDLINKVKTILKPEIESTGAQIVTYWNEDSFYSLPQYVESIFYNLLSNAIKYRNPLTNPVITITNYYRDQFLYIEISDNGLGIDLDKYGDKLFNLYKRFHFHVEGKGLGLYLIKTQLQSLGGRIEVTSKINIRATFRIMLPVMHSRH